MRSPPRPGLPRPARHWRAAGRLLLALPPLLLVLLYFWPRPVARAPFGAVLGVTDGGVEVYSCDYSTANKTIYNCSAAFDNYYNGEYTGMKFQCVELARRYWLINEGVVFESIPNAYDIFGLSVGRRVADNATVPLARCPNGGRPRPSKGNLLIWEPYGEYNVTGHVAVILRVHDHHVDIAEQNVLDEVWPPGQNYSRRLKAGLDAATGGYRIQCSYRAARILGWVAIAAVG